MCPYRITQKWLLARTIYIMNHLTVTFIVFSWVPGYLVQAILTKPLQISTLAPCCLNLYQALGSLFPSSHPF